MSTSETPLSPEVALALLTRVAHVDRLPAGRLQPPVGLLPGAVRSAVELQMLLTPESRGIAAVNLEDLVTWIRSVIGDVSLATRLERAFAASACYADSCQEAWRLLGERLDEARRLPPEEQGVSL